MTKDEIVEKKNAALRLAKKQFKLYEKQHRDKCTDESTMKAEVNKDMAKVMARALAL